MKTKLLPYFSIIIFLFACNSNPDNSKNTSTAIKATTPILNYDYIRSYPHDTTSFTEGLLMHNGKLYESTGYTREFPQTRSLFGVVNFTTGKIETKVEIDKKKYFGEGITFLNGKVFQLTYKTKIGFIYDATTFKKLKEFTFPSKEGWGMTTDGTNLIMSDGTNILTYLDPNTLKLVKNISVTENGNSLNNINELEFVKGYIYANVYTTNTIVKINPEQSLDYAMRTYNSKAMTEILLWNYKEGEFLLYGAKDKKTEKMSKDKKEKKEKKHDKHKKENKKHEKHEKEAKEEVVY